MSNRHGMTGATLEQPTPPLRRKLAMYDSDQPCTEHSPSYGGGRDVIPCTGPYQCNLCGAAWGDDGRYLGPAQWSEPAT